MVLNLLRVSFITILIQLGRCYDQLGPRTHCPPNLKGADLARCHNVTTAQQMKAVKWLETPTRTLCKKIVNVHGIAVCEDDLPQQCTMLSVVVTELPVNEKDLLFEIEWSKRCKVIVLNYFNPYDKRLWHRRLNANLEILGRDSWKERCYSCLRRDVLNIKLPTTPDILKLHVPDVNVAAGMHVDESASWKILNPVDLSKTFPWDGAQYTMMAGVFFYYHDFMSSVKQVIVQSSFSIRTMVDAPGAEVSHGLNMWASAELLKAHHFAAFSTQRVVAEPNQIPRQMSDYIGEAEIDVNFYYIHSLTNTKLASSIVSNPPVVGSVASNAAVLQHNQKVASWKPTFAPPMHGTLPIFCSVPPSLSQTQEMNAMQRWIDFQLTARCAPLAFTIACTYGAKYRGFLNCPQDQMNQLAFEYGATKGWCNFDHPVAEIEPFKTVSPSAVETFNFLSKHRKLPPNVSPPAFVSDRFKLPIFQKRPVKLAFSLIVHTDFPLLLRMFNHIYDPYHYYLIHMDPFNSNEVFVNKVIDTLIYPNLPNVFLSRDVSMVYLSSTTTMVMIQAMAWYRKHLHDWDYFVTLTGNDYPIMPMRNIEKIMKIQNPKLPFLMVWTSGVSKFLNRMYTQYPVYEKDAKLKQSIAILHKDRGRVIGAAVNQARVSNYGPPLTCSNGKSFYRLDPRRDYNNTWMDSQWLFPKNTRKRRWAADWQNVEDTDQYIPSTDGVFRNWKKSDPAFTAAYDRETVDYIIGSTEGRKNYYFFAHFLMCSEEHYIGSLLYNWPRTKEFVQSLSAEGMWTTWAYGLQEKYTDGFKMHSRFLTDAEIDPLEGMSRRGVFFARKFSTEKTPDILNLIDDRLLRTTPRWEFIKATNQTLSATTDGVIDVDVTRVNTAGMYWPGHPAVMIDVLASKDEFAKNIRRDRHNKKPSPFYPL